MKLGLWQTRLERAPRHNRFGSRHSDREQPAESQLGLYDRACLEGRLGPAWKRRSEATGQQAAVAARDISEEEVPVEGIAAPLLVTLLRPTRRNRRTIRQSNPSTHLRLLTLRGYAPPRSPAVVGSMNNLPATTEPF